MGTVIRLQCGDFQDAGIEGNLSKLEAIIAHADQLKRQGTAVSVDIVGDFYDTHDTSLVKTAKEQKRQELEKNPVALQLVEDFEKTISEIMAKYEGKDFAPTSEEQATIQKSVAKLKQEKEALTYTLIDHGAVAGTIYQLQEEMLSKLKEVPIYGVRGNNDTNYVQDILKSVRFSDLEQKMIEDGEFRIIGANNTNHDGEIAYANPSFLFECDDDPDLEKSKAYQNLNIKKTKKKANIVQLHGPSDGIGLRGKHECGSKGIPKLVEEHNPQLVECGHFHTGEIRTINGVTHARSSPTVYFEHEFTEDAKYVATNIFKYTAAEKLEVQAKPAEQSKPNRFKDNASHEEQPKSDPFEKAA